MIGRKKGERFEDTTCKEQCEEQVLCLVVQVPVRMPMCHIVVPGFRTLLLTSTSWLLLILGGSSNDLSNWIPATNIGDLKRVSGT